MIIKLSFFTGNSKVSHDHGTYIRWQIRNRSAYKGQSLLFGYLFKAFDYLDRKNSPIGFFLSPKRPMKFAVVIQ